METSSTMGSLVFATALGVVDYYSLVAMTLPLLFQRIQFLVGAHHLLAPLL